MHCFRLRLWVVYLFWNYTCVLLFDVFNRCSSVQLRNGSKGKECQTLLKVTMRTTDALKLRFSKIKNLSLGQFFESLNSRRYHWILKLLAT